MDVVFHLHPEPVATGEFQLPLPSVPAGDYRLYADVVHAIGFPETIVGDVTLGQIAGRPLAGDDAEGTSTPVGQRQNDSPALHTVPEPATLVAQEQRFKLGDGYTMVWKNPANLTPKTPEEFRFELLDANGKPPSDMALYMGMLGHAAFVKTDGSVPCGAGAPRRAAGFPASTSRTWCTSRRPRFRAAGPRTPTASPVSTPRITAPEMLTTRVPNGKSRPATEEPARRRRTASSDPPRR